jgi:hypothetical protein
MKIEVYKDSDWIDEKVTHVITSMNDEHLCRRTKKYLDAIIKGKWIVGHQCKLPAALFSVCLRPLSLNFFQTRAGG